MATNDVAWVKRVEFGKGAKGAILEVQMRALQLYMIHMISVMVFKRDLEGFHAGYTMHGFRGCSEELLNLDLKSASPT